MKKKEILDEVLSEIADLKKDIRDLHIDVKKILDKENNITFVDVKSNPFSIQKLEGKICPSCNIDISKGNVCCMSVNCPYRISVTCSSSSK